MRYVVKSADGRELTCPSLADLHALYHQGFFGDDDLVRAETSTRWVRLGAMPALRGVREQRADGRKMLLVLVAAIALAVALGLLVGCDDGGPGGAARASPFSPDVPSWRGGCFLAGSPRSSPEKIVNARPSPDVRLYGACGTDAAAQASKGGLVFLDDYDPIAGTGDVAVLLADAGSRPRVVAQRGGTGPVLPGSTGARLDGDHSRLLTLANVSGVTGTLVLVDLATGEARALAARVRVLNYDFVPGGILFVRFDPTTGTGELRFTTGTSEPRVLAAGLERFSFQMYRLRPPDRGAVAYVAGGRVFELPLSAGGPGAAVPRAGGTGAPVDVLYDAAGRLYHRTDAGELVTPSGATAPGSDVDQVQLAGTAVVYRSGLEPSTGDAELGYLDAAQQPARIWNGAPPALPGRTAPEFAAASGSMGEPFVAFGDAAGYDPDSQEGTLLVTRGGLLGAAPPTVVDAGVDFGGGLAFSPSARHLVYTRGFERPQSPGSPAEQPGIAAELKAFAVPLPGEAAAAPFVVATRASRDGVSWSADEALVAALEAFEPASDRGTLVVKTTGAAAGALALSVERVGASRFTFGAPADGEPAHLALLRDWDDALEQGELALWPAGGPAAAVAAVPADPSGAPARDVSFHLPPRGRHVLFGVRTGPRAGLWIGAAP